MYLCSFVSSNIRGCTNTEQGAGMAEGQGRLDPSPIRLLAHQSPDAHPRWYPATCKLTRLTFCPKKIQLQAYSDSHSNNQNSPIKGLFINYIIIRGGRARWTKIPHPSFPSVLLQVTRTWGGGAKNWQVISRGTGLSQKYLILLHSVAGFFCRKISLPIRRM